MSLYQEIIDDKLNLAILYFKSSNFEKALQLYNELIKDISKIPIPNLKQIRTKIYKLSETPIVGPIIHPKFGSIFDQRAATYEKLGNLDKSLKDGETLIKLEPISCKGYLRVGKILLIMNREIEAYQNYQKGIYLIEKAIETYNIVVPEKLLQNLKNQYSLLNRKLKAKRQSSTQHKLKDMKAKEKSSGHNPSQSLQNELNKMLPLKRSPSCPTISSINKQPKRAQKSIDPFLNLPLEIIELIFEKLSFRNLLECHLVHKMWYYSLTSIPTLYNHRINLNNKITFNEFSNGLKLIRRIINKTYSKQIKFLRLRSTSNQSQLSRIIESLIIEKNLKINSLDIMNKDLSLELLINKLNKSNWSFSNFSHIKQLRLGLNSSIRYENLIFELAKNLNTLEIIIIDKKMSSSNKDLLPKNDKLKKLTQEDSSPVNTLETLSIINHPKLMREKLPININGDTFNPYPIFLNKSFPNLVNLTIVSYDFYNREQIFGNFLDISHNLKLIYLENNENFTFLKFCEILKLLQPKFKLNRLTLRQKSRTKEVNLNEFNLQDLPQLNELNYLDLYSSSLSIKGLLKFLKITNKENKLSTLSIGDSNYIFFKNDKISNITAKLNLCEILSILPNLTRLYLNEMELDNSSMKFFHEDIIHVIGLSNCNLKLLDLSFCSQIDGIGLMNLFNTFSYQSKIMNYQLIFKLDELIVDGIEINQDTLNLLTKKGFANRIKNDQFKTKWKQYGYNTLVPDV